MSIDTDDQPTELDLLAEVVDLLADIHTWMRWLFWLTVVPLMAGLALVTVGVVLALATGSWG
jgi:hypothetical protein